MIYGCVIFRYFQTVCQGLSEYLENSYFKKHLWLNSFDFYVLTVLRTRFIAPATQQWGMGVCVCVWGGEGGGRKGVAIIKRRGSEVGKKKSFSFLTKMKKRM